MDQTKHDLKLTKLSLKDLKKQRRYLLQDIWILRFYLIKHKIKRLIHKED